MRKVIYRHPILSSLLLALGIAFPLMLSPIGYFPVNPIGGERLIVMDGLFSYDMPAVKNVFAQLGAEGMGIYGRFHIGDCLFAAAYGLFGFAVAKTQLWKRSRRYCVLISALPSVFDIAENISIRILAAQCPQLHAAAVFAASTFSSLKWIVLALWLVSVVSAALVNRKQYGSFRSADSSANRVSDCE